MFIWTVSDSLTILLSQSRPDICHTKIWFDKNMDLPKLLQADKNNIAGNAERSDGLHGGACILFKKLSSDFCL